MNSAGQNRNLNRYNISRCFMKKLLKVLWCGLFVAMLFSFTACTNQKSDEIVDNDDKTEEGFVKYDEDELMEFVENYDKNLEFTDELVIVVLTDEARLRIDEYTVDDFRQINPAHIEKVGKNFIFITLSEPGREQVLRAVYILKLRSDIKIAAPDFTVSPDV